MPYQPRAHYELNSEATYSVYSRPRRPENADGSYEIHLVKADNPHYIPGDVELWPILYEAICRELDKYPTASEGIARACRQVRDDYRGRKNRDF